MKKILILSFIFCFSIFAETYKTIETANVRVVFEDGLEEEAKETANYIEYLKKSGSEGFQGKLKKIPVILKKGNNFSNAFFTDLPNKLEYITIAPINGNLGVTPWLLDLSIHEYRHYMQSQLTKENTVNKIMYVLGGNQLVSMASALTLPTWVWEGDATSTETKRSNNGRGRTADFLKNYRALLNEGEEFTYEKAKNSSYKDAVPSVYHLGYLLISYGIEKYGENFWDGIFVKGSEITSLTPFSRVLKQKTGMSSTEFYKEAMKYYKEKFKEEKTVEYENVTKKSEIPTNYLYAYNFKDNLISLKRSYNENSSFYSLKNGLETKILDLGLMMDTYFEVKNGKIIWSEIEPHLTKTNTNYSNIKIYDLDSNKKINLTEKSYYYSPSFSNNGEKIAVIKNTGTESTNIDILDNNGTLIKSIENNNKYFYNYVKWSKNDKNLVVVLRDKTGKMGMISIDLEKETEELVIPFGDYILGAPFVDENNVYFSGSFDIVENTYRVSLDDKKVYKLTESNIGTNGVTKIGNSIYFSEYNSKGYNLKKSEDLVGKEFNVTSLLDDEKMNFEYLKSEKAKVIDQVKFKDYEISNYNYFKHMINIHSWDYSYFDDTIALDLYSTNELQDLNINLYYESDFKNNNVDYGIDGEFTRYWPKVIFEISKNTNEENIENKTLKLGLEFPLDLSEGDNIKGLNIATNYYYNIQDENKANYFELETTFINMKNKSVRDIVSENSQKIKFDYVVDIENTEKNRVNLGLELTSKCFAENDGFTYKLDIGSNSDKLDLVADKIMSRGYKEIDYDLATKNSFDYDFPIAYPDKGNYGFFLQRITGNIFYDSETIDTGNIENYDSLGTSLNFDTKLLSLVPIKFKIQYTYLLKDSTSDLAVGFSINQ